MCVCVCVQETDSPCERVAGEDVYLYIKADTYLTGCYEENEEIMFTQQQKVKNKTDLYQEPVTCQAGQKK